MMAVVYHGRWELGKQRQMLEKNSSQMWEFSFFLFFFSFFFFSFLELHLWHMEVLRPGAE